MADYALLVQPNPSGPNFYTIRQRKLLGYVVHITAGLEDLDAIADQSAEGVVRYAQTTDRDVSWHVSTDSDSTVELLPPGYTAWHASNYNSSTYGHEISKRHSDWRTGSVPAVWVDRTLHQAARHAAQIADAYGIPARKAIRAELDRAIAQGAAGSPVGFVGHWELDPDRRDDPGRVGATDTFPWVRFLDLVRTYQAGGGFLMALTDAQQQQIYDVIGDCYKRTGRSLGDVLADLWELFRVGSNEGAPWGFLANLLASTHAATFQDTDYGPSVLAQLAELRGRPPMDVDEQRLTDLLTPSLVAAVSGAARELPSEALTKIRDVVNDEADRRARDNDPTTGPTS